MHFTAGGWHFFLQFSSNVCLGGFAGSEPSLSIACCAGPDPTTRSRTSSAMEVREWAWNEGWAVVGCGPPDWVGGNVEYWSLRRVIEGMNLSKSSESTKFLGAEFHMCAGKQMFLSETWVRAARADRTDAKRRRPALRSPHVERRPPLVRLFSVRNDSRVCESD